MPSRIFSAAIIGLEAQLVEVEVETSYGLPKFTIVGLPDKAVEESKERVKSAIKNSGFHNETQGNSPRKVLVSLAPADMKKEGSLYDLPIALGFLAADKQIAIDTKDRLFVGELALDGTLRPIKGALSFALLAKERGFKELILPKANANEAALISDVKTIGTETLKETIDYLYGKKQIETPIIDTNAILEQISYPIEIGWIKGQNYAKRALEIAAAGGHNVLMFGPPGTGKTLLAQALPSLLPPLSFEESLEVTKIYSVTGLLPPGKTLITNRPFRSPHHTASEAALIGGGTPPKPGEITLAHRGVLFLDEFPEFHRDLLESLRQPIEEGKITVLRSRHRLSFPCRFILVVASNPCPCGYYRDPVRVCTCQPTQVAKYRRKLSGPLMDRIDLFIEVPQIQYEELVQPETERLSEQIRERVAAARKFQQERFQGDGIFTNAEMQIPHIKKYCQVDSVSQNLLRHAINAGNLSVRGYHRVLKTARTIADLEQSETIRKEHIQEALAYRKKEE
jgi:magnesium chelatase family protein